MGNSNSAAILKVAVNAPLPHAFDYLVPSTGVTAIRPGCRVRVPFGRRSQTGMVLDVADSSDVPRSKLRRIEAQIDRVPLLDEDDLWLIRFASSYYHHPIGECVATALPSLLRQGRPLEDSEVRFRLTAAGASVDLAELERRAPRQAEALRILQEGITLPNAEARERMPGWQRIKQALLAKEWIDSETVEATPRLPDATEPAEAGPPLNHEQQLAVDAIATGGGFQASLLDGITGSGKTEVYLQVMRRVLDADRQVLVLVPEIGLTPQFISRLERRLGTIPAVLHSSLGDSERLHAWRCAKSGDAKVVLGTRSAVFVPLDRPGLIVVDEEHDGSFKQQDGLRYSARDLSVARAKRLAIPVILGSATPSLESASRVAEGAYQHLRLTERAGGAVPPLLRLVDLNRYPADDGLSAPLAKAIERHLSEDGQVLVFLNRRGYAPTLICTACGHLAECQRCDSRMTVHRTKQTLDCHHCGASRPLDASCAQCGAQSVPLGQGTERVEEALRLRFPRHAITRIDSDSTRQKGAMDAALAAAQSGDARILIGTQLLSKGHHFPRLSLVGVVNADQGLFSTDFRGAERLAQSLSQVSGRAGRVRQQGEVLIQSAFPEHPFWRALFTGGYHEVARLALEERQASGWPPYSHLALIRASAHQREKTWDFLQLAAQHARGSHDPAVRVLGPVSAPMERKAGRIRGQLLLQSVNRQALHNTVRDLRSRLHEDVTTRRVRWSIDVDPIELF